MESWKLNGCSTYQNDTSSAQDDFIFSDKSAQNLDKEETVDKPLNYSSLISVNLSDCAYDVKVNERSETNITSNEMCRKAYSLPHHYKPPLNLASWHAKGKKETDQNILPKSLPPQLFKQRFSLMKEWFNEFGDEQRNRVLIDLLENIGPSQIHLLSVAIGHRLHEGCPPNCQDPLLWIPPDISLVVLSYLDPVSLAQAEQVCHSWQKVVSGDYLWKKLSLQEKWSLSADGHEQQINRKRNNDGSINWKQVFIERFRLKRNWLGAHCHIRTFEGHEEGVSCVQFDDNRIVSGSHDNTIKVWNRRTNSQWSVQTLVGHSGMVRCLHLAANRIVSGSADRTIKVWDVEETSSWSSITCKVTMVGHTDIVRCLQVKDDLVVSGSYDTSLRIWSLNTGECRRKLIGHVGPVLTVAFDQDKVISGAADMTIKIWQLSTGKCMTTLKGHKDAVTTLTFDKTRIISGSLDCTIRIWCLQSGSCVSVLDWVSNEGHTGVIRCLAADSWRIVSASDDKTIKVWDRRTGKRIVTLRNHTDGITCLAFDDYIIVSGSYDKTVKLWDFSVC